MIPTDIAFQWGPLATIVAAVLGSFGLYWKRKKDRRRRLRYSLFCEIETVKPTVDAYSALIMEEGTHSEPKTPEMDFFISTMYENSASNLALLSDEEVKKVTNYYTQGKIVVDLIEEGSQPGNEQTAFIRLNDYMNEVLNLLQSKLDIERDLTYNEYNITAQDICRLHDVDPSKVDGLDPEKLDFYLNTRGS